MPTVQTDMPAGPHASLELMHEASSTMLAALHRQIETVLVACLASVGPGQRRLFRAELAPIDTRVENLTTLVAECDPPRMWFVEAGSPEDNMSAENAAILVKAGAIACQFDGDGVGDCAMALCDFCHPDQWAGIPVSHDERVAGGA